VLQTRVGGPGHSTHSLLPPSSFYASCTNRPFRLVIRTASQLGRNGIRIYQVPVLRIFALTSLTNVHHLIIYVLSFFGLTHSGWFISTYLSLIFIYAFFYLRPLFSGIQLGRKIRTWSTLFLFKQPIRRTNYSNLFCHKTLHVSGIFSAHHQEFSTVHSALVSFMQILMTASKQSQDGTAV